jgi:RNA polymerase sigma factor (sigma-70 family)
VKKIELSEAELIVELKLRNNAAYSYLYDNYAANLFGVINRMSGNKMVSEEILQDVFVKIWKGIDGYESKRGALYTWMLNISINATIDYMKSKNARKDSITSSVDEKVNLIDKEKFEVQKEDLIGLKDEVSKLKESYKIIVEHLYFLGYTHQETAEKLDLPLGTVKTRARKAIIHLFSVLK